MKASLRSTAVLRFRFCGFAQSENTWDGFRYRYHCGTHCPANLRHDSDRACAGLRQKGLKVWPLARDHVYVWSPIAGSQVLPLKMSVVTGDLAMTPFTSNPSRHNSNKHQRGHSQRLRTGLFSPTLTRNNGQILPASERRARASSCGLDTRL